MKNWFLAIRPKTLTVAVGPVLVGLSYAWREGFFEASIALITLLAALLIQIGTNLCNDYFDHQKGADTLERVGPIRVTQAGLISPERVKYAFMGAFGLAALLGVILVVRGGWPIALIGIASLISGVAYTAGPYALAYVGLGEVFVLIFFGPVAVLGTYYLQTLRWALEPGAAGVALGLLACGILVVNNIRDVEQDKKANKKTLVVRFGKNFGQLEYMFCLLMPALIAFWLKAYASSILVLVAFLFMRRSSLEKLLPQTASLLFLYALLFSFARL